MKKGRRGVRGVFFMVRFVGGDEPAERKLVRLKSCAWSGGTTTAPPASVPASRTGRPTASTLFSMTSGESLNLKFLTALLILPFSLRQIPSRVRPA